MLFMEKSSSSLDEVSEQVKRTRIWLQSEQKLALDREMRRKQKELEQMEAEYFSARLSDLNQKKTGIQMMMNKKRREIRELEDKQRAVAPAGFATFDSKVEVEARKVDKLRGECSTARWARRSSFSTKPRRTFTSTPAGWTERRNPHESAITIAPGCSGLWPATLSRVLAGNRGPLARPEEKGVRRNLHAPALSIRSKTPWSPWKISIRF